MSTLLQAALSYAARGLHVFPCWPRAKKPACAHGVDDATIDPIVITGWWRGNPDCNIGLATGERSHLFVVDIDGAEAETELGKLEQQHSPLPATVESITVRGRHLFFAWPGRVIRNSASKIAPKIDVRGEGGYVIVPPSIHETGRRYEWSVDSANAFAPAPDWLLNAIVEPNSANRAMAVPPSEWRELIKGVAEGARDCSAAKLAGYLLRRRVDPFVVLTLLSGWNAARCTPPLPEKDIARIVDSIASRELKRRAGFGR